MSTAANKAILQVRDLSIALPGGLDRGYAVKSLDLSVEPKQIVCVVGESGSGKSMTAAAVMQILPNVLKIESGSIRLEGEELTSASPQKLCQLRGNRMAMVFQEPLTALNPVMTVGDQIAEALAIHRPNKSRDDVDRRVIELLTDVHLPTPESIKKSYPHQLSGGQRQRVMIAMALALEPALIIADEPTTALDVTTQAQILKLFRELLRKHNSGVLLITHDFGVVAEVADHVIVMRQGVVVERGSPRDIFESPQHEYTKALIEAVPKFRFRPEHIASDPPAVEVDRLNLTYRTRSLLGARRETVALQDVSFNVAKGETLGVVGESGSGKTTLAKCLLRFETPDSGSIRFGAQEIGQLRRGDLRAFRGRVQMIFQDPYKSLNPRRTVGQSITEGPIQAGLTLSEASAKAKELLGLVGLKPDSLDRYPHEFSGGQRQRICIARALAMEPDVIVADEPVSALDVSVQAQVLDLFEALRKKLGFSMIFVTHDLRVASNICDRVAVMKKGRIVEIGRTEQIFRNPSDEYTRALLDSVPGGLALHAA